jgi:thiopurine S-methyltransferase
MTISLDEQYWSQRYTTGDTIWDIGHVSPPLKTYFDQLPSKNLRILIPGAGNAYEAEYLLQHGFTNVTVCDLSELPLTNLRQRIKDNTGLTLVQGDFFQLQGKFDLIVEQTFFCALDPSLRKKYFQKMADLLVPGGKLMGVLFNDKLNDDRPPVGGNREEYLGYIPATLKIEVFDTCYNSVVPRAGREIFMLLRREEATR